VEVTDKDCPLVWPRADRWHYGRRMWQAQIVDILVPADMKSRDRDRSIIALSSGWYVYQISSTPFGILPGVGITDESDDEEEMISIWNVQPS
jgi:hypothetical protein